MSNLECYSLANMKQQIFDLEQELNITKDILLATIKELEKANEDFQATNEELIATVVELQNINEEFQSVNAELISMNAKHELKIAELTDVYNDMDNFLVSTEIATLFLDEKLYLKRFTPSVHSVFPVHAKDIGRPILQINHHLMYSELTEDIESVLSTSDPIEKEIRSYNGRWYSMRILPYRTKDGLVRGIVITFVDISDIKIANRELQKLHSAIEQSPNMVVIGDNKGNIEYANNMFYEKTGWTCAQILQNPNVPFLYFEGLSSGEYQQYVERLNSNQSWMGEMKYTDANGEFHWASVTILPFRDDDKSTIQYLILAEDISERKRVEQIIKRSEMLSALGELAAGIAHELRNPLTALKGFTRLMQMEKRGNSVYLNIMMDEFERIEAIITELLGLSKPSALSYVDKSITEILEDVGLLLETQAIIKNIELVTEYDEDLGLVHCVSNQLKQVFINVIKNSIEAMDDGGTITIRAKRGEQKNIHIQLIDQGQGIPPEVLSKIGQPFFTTKEKGTGLGMMVSFKIIEDHDGKMSITSEMGRGTTVDIVLPSVK